MDCPQALQRRPLGEREDGVAAWGEVASLSLGAASSAAVAAPPPTVRRRTASAAGGRVAKLYRVIVSSTALLLLAVASLGFCIHLLSWSEEVAALPHQYAEPVNRGRVFSPNGSGNAATSVAAATGTASSGHISVATMARTPLGELVKPQWPLFWILTAPQHEYTRCREIIASWGQEVPSDSLIFIGAAQNWSMRSGHRFVSLNVLPEQKARKELLAWKFVAETFPEREWYVKGDDDTLFVVRNLNRYLEEFDPRLPYFLGCKFHLGGAGGVQYVSGGAGYVLSRVAADRVGRAVDSWCLKMYGQLSEGDLSVAECLQTVGVVPEDTRDEHGKQRFHVFPHDYHVNWYRYGFHATRWWYHDWVWGPIIEGAACCNDNTTVSFHYMSLQMKRFTFPVLPTGAPNGGQGFLSRHSAPVPAISPPTLPPD